ncbi:MAG: D-alanyl-D-alanine carboxypeptidase family protein [Bacilli bacterium]
MKKNLIILIFIFMLILIPKVNASTDSASSYILMDETTGRVLLSKDMNSKRLIASITKIMTSTLAIESGKLDEVVEVDDTISKAYGSGIYIEVGEEITLRDLLYGLMLRSGNDAASMIAKFVGGSEEEFVNMMNNKAKELGMKNTIFYNASGLPTPHGNYSSVYDMALLTRYAMQYKEYKEIVGTKKYKVTTNKKTYIWDNKNKLLKYDFITGGKTGYTEESGRTLVSTATIDDMNLIVVTIRDSDDWNTHLELYNYAKDNYIGYKVLNKNKFRVYGDSYYKNSTLYIKNDVYIPLKKSEKRSLVSHIILEKKTNYKNNDLVGINQILLGDKLLYEENIYIEKNKKESKNIFNKIRKWFND